MVKYRSLFFKKTLISLTFEGRQLLALRGNWNVNSRNEVNFNFHQLLMLRSEDDKSILDCLNWKTGIYTSPTIQNEMLEVNMPIRFSADRFPLFNSNIN